MYCAPAQLAKNVSMTQTVQDIIAHIVPQTLELVRAHTSENQLPIDYAAIFCQSEEEYTYLKADADRLGDVLDETPTGPLYQLTEPLTTEAGPLHVLKVRAPDTSRPQRGDADFALEDYETFKDRYLEHTEYFDLIERDNFEMIELRDPAFDVLAYFSHPSVTKQYGFR